MEIVIKTDECSVLKAGIMRVSSLKNSWSLFDTNIKSSLRFIIPEEWFCLKVYDFLVGFLILQISHKSNSSLSSKSFATDFCFNEGLPLFTSKTILFYFEKFILFMSSLSSLKTCTCSTSVLAL